MKYAKLNERVSAKWVEWETR